MNKYVLTIILPLVLIGCSTITPSQVKSDESVSDSSVPSQYASSKKWILFSIFGTDGKSTGAVLTNNGHDRYNILISYYGVQFKNEYKVEIKEDAGVVPYTDQFGNKLWFINAEHLEYYQRLGDWAHNGRDIDTVWMKLKDKI